MSSNLNFARPSRFPLTNLPKARNYEQHEYEGHHRGRSGFLSARNVYHGHGRGPGRWPGLFRDRFGSGDSTQDSQSMGWAQSCLSQITGGELLAGRPHGTQHAARHPEIPEQQQQLPVTGRLDQDTMTALQQACGDQGGDGDSPEMQAWTAEIPPPAQFHSAPSSEVQRQAGPPPQTPGSDGHQSFELWFEWNSTKLRQDNEVDSVVRFASAVKGVFDHLRAAGRAGKIVLRGFSSQEGAEARNLALSVQRAHSA